MSFTRAYRLVRGRVEPVARSGEMQIEQRRSIRPGYVCAGTLACRHCDAPVLAGEAGLTLAEELLCPYCGHRAPARDFLSLGAPTRPARVAVRVGIPAH